MRDLFKKKSPVNQQMHLLRGRAATESTTELRAVLSGSTSLLAAVTTATLAISKAATAGRAVPTRRATASLTLQRARRLLEGGRHNLGSQVEVLTEELNTRVREEPVVMAPSITLSDILLALEALHELDYLKIGHALNLRVDGGIEVLLGEKDTLCKSEN